MRNEYFRRQCHSRAIQKCDISTIISFIFFPFFGLNEIFCSTLTFKQHSHAHYLGIKEKTSISQGFKGCWSFERLTKTYKYLRGKIQLCIKKDYNLVGVREISKALSVLFAKIVFNYYNSLYLIKRISTVDMFLSINSCRTANDNFPTWSDVMTRWRNQINEYENPRKFFFFSLSFMSVKTKKKKPLKKKD